MSQYLKQSFVSHLHTGLLLSIGMLIALTFENKQLPQREVIQLKKKSQQVMPSAKWLLRTTKQMDIFMFGHLRQQKCHQIHEQLLTCQNKCHKTKLRPIIQLKGFLRAIYKGNL